MKTEITREQELCALLDYVYKDGIMPPWQGVRFFCALSDHRDWLYEQLFRIMWLASEDQAAFDEEIWRLTNEAQ